MPEAYVKLSQYFPRMGIRHFDMNFRGPCVHQQLAIRVSIPPFGDLRLVSYPSQAFLTLPQIFHTYLFNGDEVENIFFDHDKLSYMILLSTDNLQCELEANSPSTHMASTLATVVPSSSQKLLCNRVCESLHLEGPSNPIQNWSSAICIQNEVRQLGVPEKVVGKRTLGPGKYIFICVSARRIG